MTEVLHVVPAPSPEQLAELAPVTDAQERLERGTDASGRERLTVRLSHDDEDVLAGARDAWLRALNAAGFRAFLV
ncbi:hypothetical protein [Deinococcus yavapaiensis]|uniref:Uncharacterized protein n=1 Tax=Deinococcus yavapaiensis KR-236 TaxID=694435 RepID=A0A318SH70_9DEIO|nr:hypothetical protein [Deinococcus yavapaiensis]PYE56465.1 hypothetical protein DES52_101269 [Deinococcus yavapaiensis KR-236]